MRLKESLQRLLQIAGLVVATSCVHASDLKLEKEQIKLGFIKPSCWQIVSS